MQKTPHHVSFLLVSGFMMAAYVLAVDALRLANWRSGKRYFSWTVQTPDNARVEANNGMFVEPDTNLSSAHASDAVFIGAGFSPETAFTRDVFSWLRRLDRKGVILGGWDTGPLVLAEAGLMGGHRMATHWQVSPAVHDRYPHIEMSSNRCEIDRRRFTGPGGISTFDLICAYISETAGRQLADLVVESANRNPFPETAGYASDSFRFLGPVAPGLSQAMAIMQKEIEKPVAISEIAARCGLSDRTFNRMFRQKIGMTPRSYYLALRLERARELLRQSAIPVSEIALMTGFNSPSRFSQAFRKHFDVSPRNTRKKPSWLNIDQADSVTEQFIRTDI